LVRAVPIGIAKKKTRTVFDLLRDTKVGDLDTALVVYKNVRAFDITMNDVAFMEIVESFQDLSNKVFHEGLFKCTVIPQ
jgi:hypothetical protein